MSFDIYWCVVMRKALDEKKYSGLASMNLTQS